MTTHDLRNILTLDDFEEVSPMNGLIILHSYRDEVYHF